MTGIIIKIDRQFTLIYLNHKNNIMQWYRLRKLALISKNPMKLTSPVRAVFLAVGQHRRNNVIEVPH